MSFFDKDILALLSLEIFRQITENQIIPLTTLNVILGVLAKNSIPFDIAFVLGNRKAASSM